MIDYTCADPHKLIIKAVISNDLGYPEVPTCKHMTTKEVIAEAKRAYEAGAAVVHFHNPWEGGERLGFDACKEVIRGIRDECDIVIEGHRFDEYMEDIHAPEFMVAGPGLIDHTEKTGTGELEGTYGDESLDRVVRSRSRRTLLELYTGLLKINVKPRIETFSTPSVFNNVEWLVAKKLVKPPYCCTWNFGMHGIVGDAATPEYLHQRVAAIPDAIKKDVHAEVSVYNAGYPRLLLHTMAIAEGWDVRVGCEDNPYWWDGVPAKGNTELIERVVRIAKEFHREVADPTEARKIYRIPALRR